MQMEVIWDMKPCQLSRGCERFGGYFFFLIQGPEISGNCCYLEDGVKFPLTFVKFRPSFTELSCAAFSLIWKVFSSNLGRDSN
jgi:hypothetical protein